MLNISSIDRNTLKIAIPLIISNITIPLVGFVDNVMMGHLGSVIYIGAIGVGAIIISYILFSFGFIKSLTTGFVSQHSGSKSDLKLLLSLAHLTLIASSISIVIIFFREEIVFFSLMLMDPSLEVSQGAKIYLDYRIWSVPAIFYRDILIGYYIGSQQTKIAMGISITVNIINILLDYIFIFYLGFSIEGVAIASLIAEYSVIFFILYAFKTEKIFSRVSIGLSDIFDWEKIKSKLMINTDMFIRSFLLMTIFVYFMSIGASYGNEVLAANTILLNFFFLFSHGIDGFAHSAEVLVGNSIGKKNRNILNSSIFSTGKLSIYLMIFYTIFFIFFSQDIIAFITNNETVNILSNTYMLYIYLIFLFATIAFWLDGVFIGAIKVKLLRNVMIISGSSFFLLETILLGGDNQGLWLSFLIFFGLRSLFLSIILYKYINDNKFLEN
ncbi:MAG: MATE family efflux transporter [Pseudomonadota bacterium]|nr:MATE family efflux transporter [Pseudomonadota bacterium]